MRRRREWERLRSNTDRFMHKQGGGSYCTQVWPPTRDRQKKETEEQGSCEGQG